MSWKVHEEQNDVEWEVLSLSSRFVHYKRFSPRIRKKFIPWTPTAFHLKYLSEKYDNYRSVVFSGVLDNIFDKNTFLCYGHRKEITGSWWVSPVFIKTGCSRFPEKSHLIWARTPYPGPAVRNIFAQWWFEQFQFFVMTSLFDCETCCSAFFHNRFIIFEFGHH